MVPDAPPDLKQWHARHKRGRRWALSPGHPADLTSVVRRWNPLASRCWRAKPRRASHSATDRDRRARSDLGTCRGAPMPTLTPSTTHDPPGNQNRAATVGHNAQHRNPAISPTGPRPKTKLRVLWAPAVLELRRPRRPVHMVALGRCRRPARLRIRFTWPGQGRRRQKYRAHRVALALVESPSSGELLCLHACEVPGCCNPNHLRWGTAADNVRDRDRLAAGASCASSASPAKPSNSCHSACPQENPRYPLTPTSQRSTDTSSASPTARYLTTPSTPTLSRRSGSPPSGPTGANPEDGDG